MAVSFARALLPLILLSLPATGKAQSSTEDITRLKFFENKIRPLLAAECYECHGEDMAKGGLRLDHIDLILEGGDTGPALVLGKPEESLLIEAVHRTDPDFEMPPRKALTDAQVASLETWIAAGATWPEESFTAVDHDENGFTEDDKNWWAIQPLAQVSPPEAGDGWARNDIDRFIARKLDENHLKPAAAAGPRELIRRIHFDLHGLPPSPQAVADFVSAFEENPDAAVAALTDELLASPRYGERWGQHWLDLVRYAESDGYRADGYRPDTWRYRDYVIRSFNEDKPYDQFVREQLAADEFAPHDPETLIGTAFLRLGIYEWNQRNARMQWDLIMTEMTNVTGEVFLGLGIGCAQCHDHKFDPILQKDHFALQAFLNSTWWPENHPLATEEELEDYQRRLGKWEKATADIRDEIHEIQKAKLDGDSNNTVKQFPEDIQAVFKKPAEQRTAHEEQLAQLVQRQVDNKRQKINWEKELAKENETLANYKALQARLAKFDHLKPNELPRAFISTDVGPHAAATKLKTRDGEQVIEPAFLTLLNQSPPDISPTEATTGRRSALADWIANGDNPLSTRVITNRIWQYHFGSGIVPTPNDFGQLGEAPSHPELLDWLTRKFIDGGWKMKDIHRLVLTSATYRQTARREPTSDESITDPLNRLLWRFPPRRLDAEQIRDAMLAISGELSNKSDGPAADGSAGTRGVFMKKRRNTRDALIGGFDAPLRFASAPSRLATTSPTQSLFLINSDWAIQRSSALAKQLLETTDKVDADVITKAFEIIYGRQPSTREIEMALGFINTQSQLLPPEETSSQKYPNKTGRRPVDQQFKDLPGLANGSRALWLQPGSRFQQLQLDRIDWPEDTFTIEAVARLDSIHKDAKVNTLLSRWNGSHSDTGWAFGITSEKSAYQPRNFILQLVGKDFQDNRIYEVVASNLRFPLLKPVYLAASIRAVPGIDDVTKGEITFFLKDLSDPDAPLQTRTVSHQIVGGLKTGEDVLSLIGGRHTHSHLWDGQLARLVISPKTLKSNQLLVNGGNAPRLIDWNFSGPKDNPPVANTHWRTPPSAKSTLPSPQLTALTDLCQALLNSNEFLYLH